MLHDAVRQRAIGIMMKLIANGADVSKEMDGYTPLQLAARSGELGSINILLDSGADVDGLNSSMQPPLRVAFSSQQYAAVVSLLANGASVPDADYRLPDKSCLMSAMDYGWIDVAKAIIRKMEDRPGRSRFAHLRSMKGHKEIAHIFAKALVKAITSRSGTEVALLLIANGADVRAEVKGLTPLDAAYEMSNAAVFRALVAKGAGLKDTVKYQCYFHHNIGAWLGEAPSDIDIAVHLVAEGLDSFPQLMQTVGSNPPWLVAYEDRNYEAFCYFVRSTLELVDAATYLKRIFRSNMLSFTKGLIDFEGTILDYAVLISDTMTIKHLIGYYNVDVNAPTVSSLKRRPIHVAAMTGTAKVINLLVATGASLDVVDGGGNTPRDIALENGNQCIERCLIALNDRHHPDIPADTKAFKVGAFDDQILSPCPVADTEQFHENGIIAKAGLQFQECPTMSNVRPKTEQNRAVRSERRPVPNSLLTEACQGDHCHWNELQPIHSNCCVRAPTLEE